MPGVGDSAGALTAATTNGVACLLLIWLRSRGDLDVSTSVAKAKVN